MKAWLSVRSLIALSLVLSTQAWGAGAVKIIESVTRDSGAMMGSPASGPTTSTRTSYFTAEGLRVEDGDQIQIYDLTKQAIYMLRPAEKTCTVMGGNMFKQMTAMATAYLQCPGTSGASAGLPGLLAPGAKPVFPENLFEKTSETKTIGKWKNCTKVVLHPCAKQGTTFTMTQWWSKDTILNLKDYKSEYRLTVGNPGPEYEGLFTAMDKLEGYPVSTETTMTFSANGGIPGMSSTPNATPTTISVKTSQVIESIEKLDTVDPKLFEVPADYKQNDIAKMFEQKIAEKKAEDAKKTPTK